MIARLSLRTGFGKLRDNEKATLRHLVFTVPAVKDSLSPFSASDLWPLTSEGTLRCLDLDEESSLLVELTKGAKKYDEFK